MGANSNFPTSLPNSVELVGIQVQTLNSLVSQKQLRISV